MNSLVRSRARELTAAREQEKQKESSLLEAVNDAVAEHGMAKDAAEKLGISPQHLCDIRAGKRGITDELLKKLERAK